MNMAPINEPNTMIPPSAATQNSRRAATTRSYSGNVARRCLEVEQRAEHGGTDQESRPPPTRRVGDWQEVDPEHERRRP